MCLTGFKHSHISSVPSILLFSLQSFCHAEDEPWPGGFLCMENGLKGAQVETQGLKHTAAVSRSLSEQFASLAFSNTLTFVMEGVLFLCSGGLAFIEFNCFSVFCCC